MLNYIFSLHIDKAPIDEEFVFMLHKKYLKIGAIYLE